MKSHASLLKKSKWNIASAGFIIISQAFIYLYITRFVSTVDLGTFSISIAFIAMGQVIIENSFTSSIIRLPQTNTKDYNAVIKLNLLLFSIYGIFIIFISYILSIWYQQNLILHFVLSLIPILLIMSFVSVQYAGLKISNDFKFVAQLDFSGACFYFISVLTFLVLGFGIWSLVLGQWFKYISILIYFLIFKKPFNSKSLLTETATLNKHLHFGKFIIAEKGLSSFLAYTDVFLVGYFIGLSQLGIYEVLKKIILRPIIAIYNAIEQVLFPLLSQSIKQPYKYLKLYKELTFLMCFTLFFILLFAYLNSSLIIQFFPESYVQFENIIKAICVFGWVVILINPLDIILYSTGHAKVFFYWQAAYALPFLICVFIAVQYSLESFILMMSAFYFILYLVASVLIRKYAPAIHWKSYMFPFLISLLQIAFVMRIDQFEFNLLIKNLILFCAFGFLYTICRLYKKEAQL